MAGSHNLLWNDGDWSCGPWVRMWDSCSAECREGGSIMNERIGRSISWLEIILPCLRISKSMFNYPVEGQLLKDFIVWTIIWLKIPIENWPTQAPSRISISLRQYMVHYSLHQFPALGLRLHQPGLKFIVEGREMVQRGDADMEATGSMPKRQIFISWLAGVRINLLGNFLFTSGQGLFRCWCPCK